MWRGSGGGVEGGYLTQLLFKSSTWISELDSVLASTNYKLKNIRGVLDSANRELNYPHGSTVLHRAY